MWRIVGGLFTWMFWLVLAGTGRAGAEARYDIKPTAVTIKQGDKDVFSYRFDRPQHIHDVELSPSGYYAYVWHSSKPPRRLKIFRLTDQKMLADFVPGYGGGLTWTAGDRLIHAWGCGTSCQSIRVYDVAGGTLHEEVTSGSEISEFGYFLVFQTAGDWQRFGLRMHDVLTGKQHILLKELADIPSNIVCFKNHVRLEFEDHSVEKIELEPFLLDAPERAKMDPR